ncbi:CheY chemotaxis protein or a CheY-like REC (receiver) domain [Spirosoma fluviale]|uniref:CheY chemotaxis protein or a CheY-like REC (Receiver) domain n=2 Tax=Spirosoma fluviale TaxID=1597977 RepID=A0A286GJ77_9BACT|nr:CheY chemotaxis protein or a CheY-like REC (receiver) domain [Spirosoma fluviale]
MAIATSGPGAYVDFDLYPMTSKAPILVIEDDEDDQLFIQEALTSLAIVNPVVFFTNGVAAIEYLMASVEAPLVILCDVNMPAMNGLELRKLIDLNEYLKPKCIPFVFLTTAADLGLVNMAYKMTIQGYFKKERTFSGLQEQLRSILDYWDKCLHPNSRFS